MKYLLWWSCLVAAPWLAIGGLVALCLHVGVVEVVAVELAALVLVLTGGLLLADDVMGPRS